MGSAKSAVIFGIQTVVCLYIGLVTTAYQLFEDDNLVGEVKFLQTFFYHAAHVASTVERTERRTVFDIIGRVACSIFLSGVEHNFRGHIHCTAQHVFTENL